MWNKLICKLMGHKRRKRELRDTVEVMVCPRCGDTKPAPERKAKATS